MLICVTSHFFLFSLCRCANVCVIFRAELSCNFCDLFLEEREDWYILLLSLCSLCVG